ncbi:hypothetical protein SynBIOSE41_01241 [Synechococcus sp. BIOS-E4-1]|nr:hypothetical protein SynBIOSE41_01241 [Synechococcus sp. BIOS-E4-1]
MTTAHRATGVVMKEQTRESGSHSVPIAAADHNDPPVIGRPGGTGCR